MNTNPERNPEAEHAPMTPELDRLSRRLLVAADELHRAIADASPERGREMLAVLRLAGALPTVTIMQTDAGAFEVHAGLVDRDTGKNLSIFERHMVRTDLPAARSVLQ